MNTNRVNPYVIGLLLAIGIILFTGCAGETTGRGVDAETDTAPSVSAAPETVEPPAETVEPPAPAYLSFGDEFIYEDGLSVTVSPPGEYEPSEYAAYTEAPAYLRFTITITNGSTSEFDPSMTLVYVQSGGAESEEIFDSENGLVGAPSGMLLPGRSLTFDVAFGVADAADLVVQVEPSFLDYEPAIFVTP